MPHPAILPIVGADSASCTAKEHPVITTLHLIGNAHLDPVWLWDWREGMNEGIATCRAMVSMLREFPEFRFIRGEAAVYDYIERYAPDLFEEIKALVASGRWDIVGGNWIQPDTNLPSTEALLRQFVRGKGYFREKFGVDVSAGWAADSFGHAAGLPEILTAAGINSFAFTRPQQGVLPMPSQAFWWEGQGGARVLGYRPNDGWYASERPDISGRLDACVSHAQNERLQTVAMFYGLGNHGGGPSRVHLREIREWARRNPHVRVEHSGLHRFFAALRRELAECGEEIIPTHRGELNFCLRGCSASVARFKYAYRRAESIVLRAERTVAACAQPQQDRLSLPLQRAWDTLLFNAFHDILPGTAIERAFDDQQAQLGGAYSAAQTAETAALTKLAARMDTTVGAWKVPADHPQPQPVLVWNPHPWPLNTQIEAEVSLDHRPLWQYQNQQGKAPVTVVEAVTGRRLRHQVIEHEHDSLVDVLWRCRVVVPVVLPPMGWSLLQIGMDPLGVVAHPEASDESLHCDCATVIRNKVIALHAEKGAEAVTFMKDGLNWLPGGLQVRLYEDPWGAWGGMKEEPASWMLEEERERLMITHVEVLEHGPERSALWVCFSGAHSRLEMTFLLSAGSSNIELRARAFLGERGARLKLVLPAGGAAEYAVPGRSVRRMPCGEVPGGRWVRAGSGVCALGFASDALYGFDTTADEFRATIARTSRYASDVKRAQDEQPWQPCADMGEHRFRALLTPDLFRIDRLADELEESPVVLTVPAFAPKTGDLLRAAGSFLHIPATGLKLLAMQQVEGGVLLRLQNTNASSTTVTVDWLGRSLELGNLSAGQIRTWKIAPDGAAFDG